MQQPMRAASVLAIVLLAAGMAAAQEPVLSGQRGSPNASASTTSVAGVVLPTDYVIGVDDVLAVSVRKDKDLSADVVVRPDGHFSLNLLNDVQAAGLTPDQLRLSIELLASKYYDDPGVAVMVKEVRSRKVYITGSVSRPNTYALTGPLNVMQLIALAGGLNEYADSKNIQVIRFSGSRTEYLKFNYKDVLKQKNVQQNVALRPGDMVVVP